MPRTRRRSGVCIEPMGDRREPASSRGIDVRWSRSCNVEEPDRPHGGGADRIGHRVPAQRTMLILAIRTINESSAGRVCGDVDLLLPRRCRLQRRAHPVERLRRPQTRHDRHVRRHRALHRGTALGILVVGRILQGGSVIKLGLAFLIMREHLSGPAFGTCCGTGHRQHPGHVESLAPVHLIIGNVIQITFLRLTVREKPRLLRGSKSSVLPLK